MIIEKSKTLCPVILPELNEEDEMVINYTMFVEFF